MIGLHNAWFFYALFTSLSWGVVYTLSEKILKEYGITPGFMLAVQVTLTAPLYWLFALRDGHIAKSADILLNNGKLIALFAVMATLTAAAAYSIFQSVNLKNAVVSSFVEISYPLFTVLFSYLFLKNFVLNPYALAGGGLIIAGIALIYFKA